MRTLWLKILILSVLAFLMPMHVCFAATQKGKQYVVVIDAGHGGKDAGAVDNGVREKEVNLNTALKLGNLIKKNLKDVKVVYTRDDDTFVSLQGRADIANKAKADLFISLHTNSVDLTNPNRANVNGASVYVLGLQKDKNNSDVARRENSVITLESNRESYAGFDPASDESYIIFEMAQKGNLSKSIKFADDVQKQLVSVAKRGDRGVHQAGFWVLWATSMPSVLVELDFICNPTSAEFISSSQGQQKMADAIFKAVQNYFKTLRAEVNGTAPAQNMAVTEETPVIDTPYADLPATPVVETEKQHLAPEASQNSQYNGTRRRRSSSARLASEQRVVETKEIKLLAESTAAPTRAPEPQVAQTEPQKVEADNVVKVKGKKGKKDSKSDKKMSKAEKKQQEILKRQREEVAKRQQEREQKAKAHAEARESQQFANSTVSTKSESSKKGTKTIKITTKAVTTSDGHLSLASSSSQVDSNKETSTKQSSGATAATTTTQNTKTPVKASKEGVAKTSTITNTQNETKRGARKSRFSHSE